MALQSFDDPNSDEARQHLLDRRCERKHPKRHRTIGRRKRLSIAKKKRVAHYLAQRDARVKTFKARAAAYWAGDRDEHP